MPGKYRVNPPYEISSASLSHGQYRVWRDSGGENGDAGRGRL